MSVIEARLKELDITLPEAPAPAANYVPYKIVGNQVFISGQTAKWNGEYLFTGKLGKELDIEEGQQAARTCAINILVQLKNALNGDLDRVKSCVRLGIYVNSTPEFKKHPLVGNGASNLIVEVLGDKGRHSRAAVGCNSLPEDTPVEVDAVFEIA